MRTTTQMRAHSEAKQAAITVAEIYDKESAEIYIAEFSRTVREYLKAKEAESNISSLFPKEE